MKRIININGAAGELDFVREGTQSTFCYQSEESRIEGTASVIEVEPGVYSVLWGDRSIEAIVQNNRKCTSVTIAGQTFEVTSTDPREFSPSASGAGHTGPAQLVAMMPGKVIRLLVAAGDEVKPGQGIIVIEAMKMQNEMKAPRDGKVLTVNVQPGDAVASGDVLMVIG